MTVIAAVKLDHVILMASDSYMSDGDRQLQDAEQKIWTHGDLALGMAGDVRTASAVRYGFTPPKHEPGVTDDHYMRWTFTEALRDFLAEKGLLRGDEDRKRAVLELLIAYRGRLWEIDNDLTAVEPTTRFTAVGSGGDVCRAVLHALLKSKEEFTRVHMHRALMITATHVRNVSGPYVYFEVPRPDPGECLGGLHYPPGAQLLDEVTVRLTGEGPPAAPPAARVGDQVFLYVDAPGGAFNHAACSTCVNWSPQDPRVGQKARIGQCAVLHATSRQLREGVPPPEHERLITPSTFGCVYHEALK